MLRKGYGMANLELGVPMAPDMVFELGSVTKQFTAAAILLLQERGQLRVEDDITKYLPDYPTHGQTITLENLLTHTSGIPSYTGLPEWFPHMREDLKPADADRALQGQAAGVQSRRAVGLRQLGVLPARRDHREGLRARATSSSSRRRSSTSSA